MFNAFYLNFTCVSFANSFIEEKIKIFWLQSHITPSLIFIGLVCVASYFV